MTRDAAKRSTLNAIGPNGRTIHFDDFVGDGEKVEVEGRPMIVRYDPDAPDWFVDEPTAARRCESCGEEERIPGDGIIHRPGCTPTAATEWCCVCGRWNRMNRAFCSCGKFWQATERLIGLVER